MSDLIFNEATHTYYAGGVMVPNVTRILGPLTSYRFVDLAALERARIEGVHIHKMVELYFKNDLDDSALPEWLMPRLAALKSFEAETGFICCDSEKHVYHESHGYAGTLDLTGAMPRLHADHCVLDVTRSFYAGPVIGLQLAAYQFAENEARRKAKLPRVKRRYALQLNEDGKYKLLPFEDDSDITVFIGMLNAWRWSQQHSNNLIWRNHEPATN